MIKANHHADDSVTLSFDPSSSASKLKPEEVRKIADELSDAEWSAMQAALDQNNRNIFRALMTPEIDSHYSVFQYVLDCLRDMKVKGQDEKAVITAKGALEKWNALAPNLRFPENHALQIWGFLLTARPDPDALPSHKQAWEEYSSSCRTAGFSDVWDKNRQKADKFISAAAPHATGTALSFFADEGWIDPSETVQIPASLVYGEGFYDHKTRDKLAKARTDSAASKILEEARQETINAPSPLGILLLNNPSAIRFYALKHLPENPTGMALDICKSAIVRLTEIEEKNAKGVDVRHAAAIGIAKKTDIWNERGEGLIGASVATHLILSGNAGTAGQICSMIDYLGNKGVKLQEGRLLEKGSLIQEVVIGLSKMAKTQTWTNMGSAQHPGDSPKNRYRFAKTVAKRLVANAGKMGLSYPSPEEVSNMWATLSDKAASFINNRVAGGSKMALAKESEALAGFLSAIGYPNITKKSFLAGTFDTDGKKVEKYKKYTEIAQWMAFEHFMNTDEDIESKNLNGERAVLEEAPDELFEKDLYKKLFHLSRTCFDISVSEPAEAKIIWSTPSKSFIDTIERALEKHRVDQPKMEAGSNGLLRMVVDMGPF